MTYDEFLRKYAEIVERIRADYSSLTVRERRRQTPTGRRSTSERLRRIVGQYSDVQRGLIPTSELGISDDEVRALVRTNDSRLVCLADRRRRLTAVGPRDRYRNDFRRDLANLS